MLLTEELFLLCIDDGRGEILDSAVATLRYGLAGALLSDLALAGRLRLLDHKKLAVQDATPTGEPLLDAALQRLYASDYPHKTRYWVGVFSQHSKALQHDLALGLAAEGVLRQEKKRRFLLIPYTAYAQQDASAKYWIKQDLRSLVLAGSAVPPSRLALLSLVRACDLLSLLFTRDERKAAARRVDDLVRSQALAAAMGEAVAETIQVIEAAAIAAAIAAGS